MSSTKLETLLAAHIADAGLPEPVREHPFQEGRKWRFDFAWPGRQLAAEVEGGTWTGGRHVRPRGFESDCEKYNHAALAGWIVLRFTGEMIRNGAAAQMIKAAMTGEAPAAWAPTSRNGRMWTAGTTCGRPIQRVPDASGETPMSGDGLTSAVLAAIGEAGVQELTRQWGGVVLSLPRRPEGAVWDMLVETLGEASAAALVARCGGERFYCPSQARRLIHGRILDLTANGWSASRISQALGCSIRTVRNARAAGRGGEIFHPLTAQRDRP